MLSWCGGFLIYRQSIQFIEDWTEHTFNLVSMTMHGRRRVQRSVRLRTDRPCRHPASPAPPPLLPSAVAGLWEVTETH